jgi:5-methyltetrahydrofolate--homocysteine methyltransferase
MLKQSFLNRIYAKETLVADGATGSTLIARGLPSGMTSETWVVDHPEKIIQLHKILLQQCRYYSYMHFLAPPA